jgi:hypothetical protein
MAARIPMHIVPLQGNGDDADGGDHALTSPRQDASTHQQRRYLTLFLSIEQIYSLSKIYSDELFF